MKTFFTILLSVATLYAYPQWHWVNPYPTGYAITDVDFVTESTGYVIGEKGLLMKTLDAGETWEIIPTNTYTDFRYLWFTSEMNGYASTLDAQILKTNDGGYSWQTLQTDTLEMIYDIFFLNEDTGFIAADHGNLLRTQDGGSTWERAFINQYMDLTSVFFVNNNIGYTTSRLGRYYKTTDGGDTWTMYTDPAMMDLNDVYFLDQNTGFIAGDDGFFMRTTNGGDTWISMNCGSVLKEIKFFNGLTGYAIASDMLFGDSYFVKTTNAGNSWSQVGMDNIISFQFINDDTVIGTGIQGRILKSTDSGVNYTNYTTSATYANFVDIHFPTSQIGYAVGSMGEIVKTTDAGEHWQLLSQSPAQRLNGIRFTTEDRGFVTGDSSLYITDDGGVTWNKHPLIFPGWMTKIIFLNTSTGYLIGEGDGLIYKTTDGGNNWNLLYQHSYHWPRGIYFLNPDTGYVALETSILKTINGGIDWTETELSNTQYVLLLDIFFPTDMIGYAGGFGGKLYKTTDGGESWSELFFSGSVYYTIISIHFTDENKGFLGCDASGFFQTADGGNTWTKIQYMTGFHDAIWFSNNTTGYVAGSYGKIMKTTNAGAVPVFSPDKPNTAYLLYPNPATDEFTLTSNSVTGPISLTIYNCNGLCISFDRYNSGTIKIKTANIPSGLYFLRINSEKGVEVKKLVVI